MKQHSTHNILMALLAGTFAVLSAGRVAAQQAAPEPEPEPAEVVRVNTRLVRLGIAVTSYTTPVPEQLRWEVQHDAQPITDLIVDTPGEHNPLALVLLIDVARQGDGACYSCLSEQIKSLAERLHLKTLPRVVVAASPAARMPLKWPEAWLTTYAGDTRAAFTSALDAVEHSPNTRRALLVVTNQVAQLPAHAFEDADDRLAQSATFIYLMTVRPPKVRSGTPGCVIARSNLSTLESFSMPLSADYMAAQFKHFVRLANALHVVSYRLPESDSTPGGLHRAEVKAITAATGRVFLTQTRAFTLN
jgi:hypothetical protein